MKRDERMANNMNLAKNNGMTLDELGRLSFYDYHVLLEKTRADSHQKTPSQDDW